MTSQTLLSAMHSTNRDSLKLAYSIAFDVQAQYFLLTLELIEFAVAKGSIGEIQKLVQDARQSIKEMHNDGYE